MNLTIVFLDEGQVLPMVMASKNKSFSMYGQAGR